MSGHQCAQTLPLSTRLTARPIWNKTKNKDFMKSVAYEKRRFSKDHLQGIVTLCLDCVPHVFGYRRVPSTFLVVCLGGVDKVGCNAYYNTNVIAIEDGDWC